MTLSSITNFTKPGSRIPSFAACLYRATRNFLAAGIFVLSFLLSAQRPASAATYFVDQVRGSDAATGLALTAPWQSLDKINATEFHAGDQILFHAGEEWRGQLAPRGSGRLGAPIIIGRYGEGVRPLLRGDGEVPFVLILSNQEYWEINDLQITNFSSGGAKKIRGIEIRGRDAGVLHHIHLSRLEVRQVNAISNYTNDGDVVAKSFGAIATIIEGEEKPTAWDDLLLEDCVVAESGPMGFVMLSSWMSGHRTNDAATWFPSRNVVVRGCTFRDIGRNGLVVRACARPLIERNIFLRCGLSGSGNACFPFHCDDALFQYNEASFTKYNPGDSDAAGFDCDYNCRRTVYQYNYSHDNDYGFIVLCVDGKTGFNEGSVVRYNISENDGGCIFRISGTVRQAEIYNNTIFVRAKTSNPRGRDPVRIVYHKSWAGWSSDIAFRRNLIINECALAVYEPGQSFGNRYEGNLFSGMHPYSEPTDKTQVSLNPALVNPGHAGPGLAAALAAYAPREDSPMRTLASSNAVGAVDARGNWRGL